MHSFVPLKFNYHEYTIFSGVKRRGCSRENKVKYSLKKGKSNKMMFKDKKKSTIRGTGVGHHK